MIITKPASVITCCTRTQPSAAISITLAGLKRSMRVRHRAPSFSIGICTQWFDLTSRSLYSGLPHHHWHISAASDDADNIYRQFQSAAASKLSSTSWHRSTYQISFHPWRHRVLRKFRRYRESNAFTHQNMWRSYRGPGIADDNFTRGFTAAATTDSSGSMPYFPCRASSNTLQLIWE